MRADGQGPRARPARFVNIDRDTPRLLAPDLREWVADHHLCQFIMDAVAELDLGQVKVHEAIVQVLGMAQELKVLKVGQNTVAVDGSKVLANASQHGAVSQERAGRLMEQLESEVAQLMAKAEAADSTPLEEGLTIPGEITRRQERKAQRARSRKRRAARTEQTAAPRCMRLWKRARILGRSKIWRTNRLLAFQGRRSIENRRRRFSL